MIRRRGSRAVSPRYARLGQRSSGSAAEASAAWSPLDLPNLALLIDPERQALSDGDPVSSYDDPSVNAFAFTQSTSAAKPTWKESGQNGQPYWSFDGGDHLESTGHTDPLDHETGQLWIVHDPEASGWNTILASADTAANADWWRFHDAALSDHWGVHGYSAGNLVKAREATAVTAVHIREWDSDGANYHTWRDNVSRTVNVFVGTDGVWLADVPNRDVISIGALVRSTAPTDYYTGRIYLLALTSQIESAADTTLMRNYLHERFDLGVAV